MTRRVFQAVPTLADRPGDLARMIARLLGPAWQAPDGSVNAAQFSADGDTLDATLDTLDTAAAQSYPREATDSLEDWERVLYLPVDPLATTTVRQANALAATRGTLSGSTEDLLATAQTLIPGATLREYTATEAAALGSQRYVFTLRFALGASYGDTEIEARLRGLLRPAAPAHVQIEFASTLYDALTTESSEELLTETGEELTTET